MQDHNIRRLRLYSAEHEISGSSTSREHCIRVFLNDLGAVLSERFIDGLSDQSLGALFVDWLSVVTHVSDPIERQDMLIRGWSVPTRPFTVGLQMSEGGPQEDTETSGSTVVSLHERAGR